MASGAKNLIKDNLFFPLIKHKKLEKAENAGYQHFLLFQQYFQKASLQGC